MLSLGCLLQSFKWYDIMTFSIDNKFINLMAFSFITFRSILACPHSTAFGFHSSFLYEVQKIHGVSLNRWLWIEICMHVICFWYVFPCCLHNLFDLKLICKQNTYSFVIIHNCCCKCDFNTVFMFHLYEQGHVIICVMDGLSIMQLSDMDTVLHKI